MAYESGVADTVDPLAGSYYIEALTNEIERRAKDYIERIDNLGGALRAIEMGFIQREIAESAYRYQKEIESGDRVVVGVNRFIVEEEIPIQRLKVDPSVRERQIERLKALRRRRNNERVGALLKELEEAAKTSENLFPLFIECVKSYATLGEICDVLRRVFGEYRPGMEL
jgi:methylmalonyl-CoA mutase N-terminal domain/subunit